MDMSWALPTEITDQFLDLLDTPLQTLGTEFGEGGKKSELIEIV